MSLGVSIVLLLTNYSYCRYFTRGKKNSQVTDKMKGMNHLRKCEDGHPRKEIFSYETYCLASHKEQCFPSIKFKEETKSLDL